MPKMNISVFLNTYADAKGTNSPNFVNFKWVREINGIMVDGATSLMHTIAPNTTLSVFTAGTKKLVYLETSAPANISYNGAAPETIKPLGIGASTLPGISLKTSDITSLTITNPSLTDSITVFVATVE